MNKFLILLILLIPPLRSFSQNNEQKKNNKDFYQSFDEMMNDVNTIASDFIKIDRLKGYSDTLYYNTATDDTIALRKTLDYYDSIHNKTLKIVKDAEGTEVRQSLYNSFSYKPTAQSFYFNYHLWHLTKDKQCFYRALSLSNFHHNSQLIPLFTKANKEDNTTSKDSLPNTFQCSENRAYISYFYGKPNDSCPQNNRVYALLISQDSFRLIDLGGIQELDSLLNKLLVFLEKDNRFNKDNAFEDFVTVSHALYQFLIAPLNLQAEIKALSIIPDNKLWQLPFDILLTSDSLKEGLTDDYSPNNLSYLIKDYCISYHRDMLYLINETSDTKRKTQLAALYLAPVHFKTEKHDQLADTSLIEHLKRATLLTLTSQTNSNATKSRLKELAKQADIIHFHTHGVFKEYQNRNKTITYRSSVMLLASTPSNDSLLPSDIETLDLQKNPLVVLGACHSGSGGILLGVGPNCSAFSFHSAGAIGTIHTLFAVDEKTTSTIFNLFYTHLFQGHSIDSALHMSKLEFLESISESDMNFKCRPDYWSGFVYLGNPVSLVPSKKECASTTIFIVAGIIICCFLFFLLIRRRVRFSKS